MNNGIPRGIPSADLQTVFDDCLNRMNDGQTIAECLRTYPDYAARLRPLLETSITAKRGLTIPTAEVLSAKDRVRARMLQEVSTMNPPSQVTRPTFTRLLGVLLAATFGLMLIAGGVMVGVSFIQRLNNPTPTIAVLNTATATPTLFPSATMSPTFTPTSSPTLTSTATPTLTITSTNTTTTTATMTASVTATMTRTAVHSKTPTATPTNTDLGCVVDPPEAWVNYALRAGDTLSSLAVATDTTVQEIILINCITDPRGLLVGDELFLPKNPIFDDGGDDEGTVSPTPDDDGGSDDGGGDDNGGSDNGGGGDDSCDDNGNDDSCGDDNSGSNDDNGGDDNGGGDDDSGGDDDNSGSG